MGCCNEEIIQFTDVPFSTVELTAERIAAFGSVPHIEVLYWESGALVRSPGIFTRQNIAPLGAGQGVYIDHGGGLHSGIIKLK